MPNTIKVAIAGRGNRDSNLIEGFSFYWQNPDSENALSVSL